MRSKLKEYKHLFTSGHFIREIKIKKWLNSDGKKLLQVGCGPHSIEGAMNADILRGDIYLDATNYLPFPSYSIDYIFTEQFIEHLTFEEGKFFISEAFRVLKNSGVIRQATPSLKGLIDIYEGENKFVDTQEAIGRHVSNHSPQTSGDKPSHFLNDFFRLWEHEFIYDKETLADIHMDAGFESISWKSFGNSSYPELSNLERHADADWMKRAFVIICEASKEER
jgi:predicted SAM-dependent methyltransferase